MPTDKERREVAENLRNLTIGRSIHYKEQFFDELAEVVVGFEDYHDFYVVLEKLADLIDPTNETCELERELEQLKAKLGAVERIADKYHDKASTILESWREDPMGGTDLGRFYAFEQMVGEIWEVFG